MRTAERKKNLQTLKSIVCTLLPIALLCVFYLLCTDKEAINAVQDKFSMPTLRFLGSIFSKVPISFLELFISVAVIAGVSVILKLLFGRRMRMKVSFRTLLAIIALAAWIWNGYCWLWNSGYYSDSFAKKAGLETDGLAYEDLYSAAEFFCSKANELSDLVPRDENGVFYGEFEDFAESYDTLYNSVDEEFPFIAGQTTKPKAIFFSKIMSYMGYTGLLFPFTGETYINTEQPDWDIPNTIGHEIAHQRGVHFEAEANFLGIAACIQSDDVRFRYSGYMSGLIHLSNALYYENEEAYWELTEQFSEGLAADWNANNQYWSGKEGTLNKVVDTVYTTYLQINQQPSGLKSYGECVDILVLWLNTSEYSPLY